MKKLFPTLVLAAALPGGAMAQSAVSLEGVIDGGLRRDTGATSGAMSSVGSGNRLPSRLTFTGVEDLGSGLRAGFVLESGFSLDTGAGSSNAPNVTGGGLSFGRTAAVSLGRDDTGYLSLGRQYTPLFSMSAGLANDPFANSWLGGVGTVYNTTSRASNSVAYSYGYTVRTLLLAAPRKGLGVAAMYVFPETVAPAPVKAGQQAGFNVSYGDGNWWAGYGYHQVLGSNTDISATATVTDQPKLRQQTLAASYENRLGRFHLGFNWASNGSTVDRRNWQVAANLPVADVHVLKLLYGRANDRTAVNADFSTFQIGYEYNLSRRTSLYAGYGQVDNNANAQQILTGSLGTYAKGSHPRSMITGIKHVF